MNFGEIRTMVIETTKRPDKVSETNRAINAAIALFSSVNFPHDRVELTYTLLFPTLYINQMDVTASPFERFKVIDYIRPSGYRRTLGWRDPKKIFQNGCENLDVYYRSGNNIILKLSNLQTTLEVAYFQYHEVHDDADDEDWMFDQLTEAIILHARGKIMRDIGEDAEANNNIKEALFLWEAYKGQMQDLQG